MTVLQIEALSVGYGRRRVLDALSLAVQRGEILAVLGENGSGKTTLLRAIQGSIPLQEGSIAVQGTDLAALSTKKRAELVTTMAQDFAPEPGLTGMERIEMGLYPRKVSFGRLTPAEELRIREMADTFGVLHLLERDLGSMSTGERQMIALLRAAVQDTPVLLLDEPASALDFNRTEALFSFLGRLAAAGKTILIVLHDPTQALRYADRLLRLEKNGTAQVLDPAQTEMAQTEAFLRVLYPNLRIHRDPLFCYTEENR